MIRDASVGRSRLTIFGALLLAAVDVIGVAICLISLLESNHL